jgi:hypothetical protein
VGSAEVKEQIDQRVRYTRIISTDKTATKSNKNGLRPNQIHFIPTAFVELGNVGSSTK